MDGLGRTRPCQHLAIARSRSAAWKDQALATPMLEALEIQNFRKFDRYALTFGGRNLLVGPNNAGKSTLIEALRLISIVVNRFGALNFGSPPDWLDGIESSRGVNPSLRGLDFDLGRETFHQYNDPPAIVTARFSGGSIVTVYLGPQSDIYAVVRDSDGAAITNKSQARLFTQARIGIQPQVGPLARNERPLADRYVRGSLDSTLAPTHFRNQLRLLEHHFDSFKTIAERTWPTLRIDGLDLVGLGAELHLELFVRDGAFVGEVAAMGHGLQMWLQLMWFLARSRDDGTIVLDEPDVYMHPDLQRRLIRFLLGRGQQVIVATHSIEMMAEVDPHELVPIDAGRRSATRARDLRDVQKIVDQLGGVHNIEFARLSRARRYLVASASDQRMLRRWQDVVAPAHEDALDVLPTFPIEAWEDWPYVVAMKRAIDSARDDPAIPICLLAADLRSEAEIESRRREARRESIELHVWRRRSLANYLLSPRAIARAARHATGLPAPTDDDIASRLAAVLESMTGRVLEDAPPEARAAVRRSWETQEGRMALAPARVVLLRMAGWMRQEYGCSIGMPDVMAAFTPEDISPELTAVLEALRFDRPVSSVRESVPDTAAWSTSASDVSTAKDQDLDEILDLFQAAGVIDPEDPSHRGAPSA